MSVENQEVKDAIYQAALENAVLFKGQANPKALIGKIMPKFPEMKSDMKTLMSLINSGVEEVNALGFEKQQELLLENNPDFFEEKEEKNKKISKLPDVPQELQGKPLIMRFPPAPSGNLHLGHLFGLVYNYEYAKQSGGEIILRLEDTNPENISLDNYTAVIEDAQWVCDNSIKQIFYQSDRIELYYKYLQQLIEQGDAYVCEQDLEVFKELVDNKQTNGCRELDSSIHLQRFEKMKAAEYEEGQAVIRIKTNLEHKNPAMRDFGLARVKYGNHARVGDTYALWPMYNLCCAIDDSVMNVSYIVRGKDLEVGAERQDIIKDKLGFTKVPYFHYGKMKFTDLELSKTKLTEQIKQGVYDSWDDVRLPTIKSFRKRGFRAQAFRKLLVEMGMSKRDSKISSLEYMKSLEFFNKEIIEPISKRAFSVMSPKNVIITNFEEMNISQIQAPVHPANESLGKRLIEISNSIVVEEKDTQKLQEGDLIRLMHFANFEIISNSQDTLELKYISQEYSKDLKLKGNIHFVCKEYSENIQIVNTQNVVEEVICEKLSYNLEFEDYLQFERVGYVKFEREGSGKKLFYFTQE
ncbi:MAG: glutamate--tRNA ligase [Nanoarchaeota archaeon]|nr:glutamate--tRNA ligase [Nanoarchaeota archaeon]